MKTPGYLGATGFAADFVRAIWLQWLGQDTTRTFKRGIDAMALVTSDIASDAKTAWTALATQAGALDTDRQRLIDRLTADKPEEGAQSSAAQRAIFASLVRPSDLDAETDPTERVNLLSHIRVLHFDLRDPNGSDAADTVVACQRCLSSGDGSEARRLWERLIGIADEMRPLGGSLDLPRLLAMLRGQFNLLDHPDYAADWRMLARRGEEATSDIEEQIAGQRIDRTNLGQWLATALSAKQVQFVVGESGVGKSALAKQVASAAYSRRVWLTGASLDYPSESDLEGALKLHHPLADTLIVSPESCLVVFDGVEGFSPNARKLVGRLISRLTGGSAPHIHIALTVQFEAADVVIRDLVRHGLSQDAFETFPVARPVDQEVMSVISGLPQLASLAHRPELRPVLSNLKVLDLTARTLRGGQQLPDGKVIGLTSLIDLLWSDWAEDGPDGLRHTQLLQSIASNEADSLSNGVARRTLGFSEQSVLLPLRQAGLVRLRDERVVFTHDMIGDWARMRILVGENPITVPASRARVRLPRWQRAVRLFGQRLLEQSEGGLDQWRRVVENGSDQSEDAALMRDLFLEALFLATNSAQLLEHAWPALVTSDATLLRRLIDRFLYVATLPDLRMLALAEGFDPSVIEHAFRIPFWPYWGPLLSVLHAHAGEVAESAPTVGARLSSLWLRTIPLEPFPGVPMPWRREAAELALAIAREAQVKSEEGPFWGGMESRVVFEAALQAARDLPEDVAELFLELAKRRDLSEPTATRVELARQKRREERAEATKARRSSQPSPHGFSLGRLRSPWPDGAHSTDRGRSFQSKVGAYST